jgi:voltage-gated potassium channel Kch
MREATWRERWRYAFDNMMARGAGALLLGLGAASLVVILAGAAALSLFRIAPEGEPAPGFLEGAWLSLMRTLDAGTMGGDAGWGFRLVMFVVTLGGIFLISALIGVLTTGLDTRLEELRKGRSRVVEKDHTVILGWSEEIFAVVKELLVANGNRTRPCIAILAPQDKVFMEDALRDRLGNPAPTRIVCRTGDPSDMEDLRIVSPDAARAVIVLAPEEDPDAGVLKTLLALLNRPDRKEEPYHIVAKLQSPEVLEVARLVGRGEACFVQEEDIIPRITAQTCRQAGLSLVYLELLDFEGDEIYIAEEPSLAGKTYRDALRAYEDSAVMGLWTPEGGARLNPPSETPIRPGDRIIAISEDDDTLRPSGAAAVVEERGLRRSPRTLERPERFLLLGWNRRAEALVRELEHYVPDGSSLEVVASHDEAPGVLERLALSMEHLALHHHPGEITERKVLDALSVPAYDHVILLSRSDDLPPQKADALTLITLLHLRDIAEKEGRRFSLVSEMRDLRNRELATVARVNDFIVSTHLVSLLLAQLAENRDLAPVFEDLFDADGAELYLRPVEEYLETGRPLTFYSALESASRRQETALGYRKASDADDSERNYGVVLNPVKSEPVVFEPGDRLIVLAED